jgi:predicted SnoaL-like aldol condensation-catalyzing enzyme
MSYREQNLPANVHMSTKEIVEIANRLLVSKRGLEAAERFFSPDYVEHNHATPDGNLEGMITMLREMGFTEDNQNDRAMELHIDHLICDGDLVFIHQHIEEPGTPTTVFMDLFRVQDGLIVEHWDVIQTVPENPVNARVTMI